MALCTQTEVEQRLQIDFGNDSDPVVAGLIADAQATIEGYVGRPLESGTRNQTFDGGFWTLWLKCWPVTAVASVSVDEVAVTEFAFKEKGRFIRTTEGGYQRSWGTAKPQAIAVEYTGGYLSPAHDQELAHLGSICVDVVARAFNKGADNAAIPAGASGAIQSVNLEGSDSVTYATGGGDTTSLAGGKTQFVFLTEDEQRQLDRYKSLPYGFA